MEKKLLLYLDFLGFSDKALTASSFVELWGEYQNILRIIEYSFGMEKKPIDYDFVSDSLFIWPTTEDLKDGFAQLCYFGTILFNNFNKTQLPVKGAIIYDEYYINDFEHALFGKKKKEGLDIISKKVHTIIGKGIVKAVSWEKKQNWCCISIHPDDYKVLSEIIPDPIKILKDNNSMIEYDVPTKDGYYKTLAITFLLGSIDMKHLISYYNKVKNVLNKESAKIYADETIKYLEWLYENKINVFP